MALIKTKFIYRLVTIKKMETKKRKENDEDSKEMLERKKHKQSTDKKPTKIQLKLSTTLPV
jgi:hypothetical protein